MNGTPRPDRQLPVEHDVVADSTVTYHQSVSDTNSEKGRRPAQRVAPHVGHNGPQPESIGRYRILKSLGRGGFGDVYLAHDPKLDRQVALKVNRNRQAPSPDSAAALLQEARLAAKVTHERIVTIYDVGECDESGVYVAMEFVPSYCQMLCLSGLRWRRLWVVGV
jgi:serine/threonine protein kinase